MRALTMPDGWFRTMNDRTVVAFLATIAIREFINALDTAKLKGRIVQVRQVARGDSIGYGASVTAARASRVAAEDVVGESRTHEGGIAAQQFVGALAVEHDTDAGGGDAPHHAPLRVGAARDQPGEAEEGEAPQGIDARLLKGPERHPEQAPDKTRIGHRQFGKR
jgi:hypothetical protein